MGINSDISEFLIDETPDKFKIDRMEFQNEKDLNQALNAARTVLNYIKIWFEVLSETDTGKDFVSGVSVQVNLLHNLTFKQDIDTTKVIDNESNNVKYQLWFDKLSKKHKNVVRYVKKHLDIFSKTRKWIENKTHKFNIKNYIKRMFGLHSHSFFCIFALNWLHNCCILICYKHNLWKVVSRLS